MKKVLLILIFLFFPIFCFAQNSDVVESNFEARVIKIVEERELIRDDGSKKLQQNLKLIGLTGDWEGREIDYYGISDIDVIGSGSYRNGDKVIVNATKDFEGNDVFYVLDHVRRGNIYLLAFIFSLIIILVGGWKGFKSLISLVVSFIVIMMVIVPQILAGNNPVMVAIIGSFLILLAIIYLTDGINRKSNIALLSILISLLITAFLSVLFTNLLGLTGTASEETAFLVSLGKGAINFKGLLLAAILIGALGVLDDVVIGQVEAVSQIREANPKLSSKNVFLLARKVGNAHLGAMVNTLFLAYAGASLPLLLLFSLGEPPFVTFSSVLNHELMATEIARTLIGSIGLALAIPISTYLAVAIKGKNDK